MGTPMTYISGNTGTYQSGTFNKGSIALNLNPSSLASGNNWYNGVDVTATQYLIYSDTYSQGQATVANSKPTAWTTPDLSDTSLLNLINTLPDRIGVLPFTSLPLALQWLNATNKYFLIKTNFENIVTSGLILNLDAGWYNSYSGTTTWFDRSGNGNNGTLVNSPTFNGSSQGAIVFDGTDDYVDCGNLSTLNNLTVQMFVNVTSNTGNYRAFAAAKGASQDYDSGFNIDMMLGSSTSFSNCNIEGGFLRIPGGTNFMQSSVPFGTWCNICFTISPTYIQFYLNGVPQYGTARLNNASSTIGMNSLSIGRRPIVDPYVNSFINAKISNTLIYSRALSAQEVLQNYNAQKSRFGIYDIVQSGNTVNLDASNYLSYPRSGTTWSDMTSTGFLGTFTNGPIWSSNSGGTITFDGTDDYIQGNQSFSAMSNNFSISTWVYPNTTQNQYAEIFGNHVDGYKGFVFQQNHTNTNNYYFAYGDNSQWNLTPTFYLAPSIWHNIVAIKNSSGTMVYDNGVLISSLSQNTNVAPTTTTLKIGLGYGGGLAPGSRYWNGKVSNFQIYNRVLSQQEIVQNYESYRKIIGSTGYTTSGLTLNLDAGNYASYPTTGTKWVDISGNYYNGTLTNGPVWSSASGGTFTFDGTDDYVRITLPTSITFRDISYNSWVYAEGLDNQYRTIIDLNNDDMLLDIYQNKFGLYDPTYDTGYVLTQNTWYNYSVSHAYGGPWYFYVNGVLVYTSGNDSTIKTADRIGIGAGLTSATTADEFWKGKISIAQIYNRALSASEILQNYNALKGRFGL